MRLPFGHKRFSNKPHYDPAFVRALVQSERIAFEPRALRAARLLFPDVVDIVEEFSVVLADLRLEEFEYTQVLQDRSPADIYHIEFEARDLYLKIKIENDPEDGNDVVAVISLHEWED
jgi:hypothetical protein